MRTRVGPGFGHGREGGDDVLALGAERVLIQPLQGRRLHERTVTDVEGSLVPRAVKRLPADFTLGQRGAVVRTLGLESAQAVNVADEEDLRVAVFHLRHPHGDIRLDRPHFHRHAACSLLEQV